MHSSSKTGMGLCAINVQRIIGYGELIKPAKRVNLRSHPIRIWNNQKSVNKS